MESIDGPGNASGIREAYTELVWGEGMREGRVVALGEAGRGVHEGVCDRGRYIGGAPDSTRPWGPLMP